MPIRYCTQPNPITPDPNDHVARVVCNVTYYLEDILKEARKRGTGVTDPDMRAAIMLLCDVVIDLVVDGNAVILPFANIRPGMSGVYNSAMDSFDPSRHTKRATLSAGNELYERMLNAKVEKIPASQPAPDLQEFTDVNTSTTNSILTPGGIGQISGGELKFNPANALEGIFLVNETGTETRITVLANRTEGRLVFSIPATLVAGNYSLQVRKGYGTAANIRTGLLNDTLRVA